MQHKNLSLALLSIGLLFALSTSAEAYDEARVRYIMADMSLGGPVSYYRGYPNDANAVEAVRRWDDGVRVTNASRFERKIVGEKGWQIVYKGTNRTIDGMDVRLTTDQAYDEARVRYIMADMSLGGPVSYYRGYPNDANAVEAVSRWDDGVRVTNASRFERKIVGEKGWQIVYKGTNRTIDGMDVRLTTD